ncbi:MAG: endopeptidase La [Lachnospiraceae bacterium]|nr:endopeptidase La [Lachnospiraceae bacterium]
MIVLPVYNMMVLPNANIYFQTAMFKKLAGRAVKDEKVVLLVKKEDVGKEGLNNDSFYPVGVSGYVREINSEGYVIVHTTGRVNIDVVNINPDHSMNLTISKRADTDEVDEETRSTKLEALKRSLREFTDDFNWGAAASVYINHMDTIEEVATTMSIWIKLSNAERYAVLETDSVKDRIERIEKLLCEHLEAAKVQSHAASAQQKEYQDMYRESALKKQIDFLQKELDEMHPEKVSDIRKFELKIEECGMNETARLEAEKVLNRLKQEGNGSAETGLLYDYLDFVTGLSWKAEEPEFINLQNAERILNEDHYGLKKVKKRIIQQIAVMNLKRSQAGSILLFVGAPGTGKTSIGRSIARALNREYVRVSLGGVRDEADIRGHRRTYIGAMPGRIMDGISKSGVSNPVMVLDEVDKLSSSYNGDPASALLEVLDPEQNNTFTDHYMNVPYDLSNVMFICTANSVDTIPEPLLNRMEVIHFEGYSPIEKLLIAKEHLLPKAMEEMGIKEGQMEISEEVLKTLISDYTKEGGVRGLRKRIDTLCRAAAVKLSEERDEPFVYSIRPEEIRDELDMRPVHHEKTPETQKSGVVTGLAWTQAGGEILYIETIFTKGKGNIIITGQLGDVMKESAQIAVSLVKSMFPEKAKLFEENDIHIHVPEGAVPKDGPSAGITMTTAIASLVTGVSVNPRIAMTGEVSLRGMVSPIGGLPEKLLAAERAGVTTALIPKENIEDLKDVSAEVKNRLTILPVTDVEEVLELTGILRERSKIVEKPA